MRDVARVFLDLESVPSRNPAVWTYLEQNIKPPAQMTKAETIAKWEQFGRKDDVDKEIAKTSLDLGLFGEIWCIGLALDDEAPIVLQNDDELELLREFAATVPSLSQGREIEWVGHYIKDFDAPFLWHRSLVRGVMIPSMDWTGRRSRNIVDTRYLWTGGSPKEHVGLDKLCLALSIPLPKGEITGAKVWEFIQAGRAAEVLTYCSEDVERTREVWRRLSPYAAEVAA